MSLAIVLLIIAILMGGVVGFLISRRTDPTIHALQEANDRIMELGNTLTLIGFSEDDDPEAWQYGEDDGGGEDGAADLIGAGATNLLGNASELVSGGVSNVLGSASNVLGGASDAISGGASNVLSSAKGLLSGVLPGGDEEKKKDGDSGVAGKAVEGAKNAGKAIGEGAKNLGEGAKGAVEGMLKKVPNPFAK